MPSESAARAPLPIDVTREIEAATGMVCYTGGYEGRVRWIGKYLPEDDAPEMIHGMVVGWVTACVLKERQRAQATGERHLRLA